MNGENNSAPVTGVYVDDLFRAASREAQAFRVGRRHGHQWCHMWCDAGAEWRLHQVARRIGLRREWFQGKPGFPHYDLTPSKRADALAAGVQYMSGRERWARKRRAAAAIEGATNE